jgi:hypothetical protein
VTLAWVALAAPLRALSDEVAALVPQPVSTRAVIAAPTTANRIRLFLNIISSVIVSLLLQLCDDGMQEIGSRMAADGKAFGKVFARLCNVT